MACVQIIFTIKKTQITDYTVSQLHAGLTHTGFGFPVASQVKVKLSSNATATTALTDWAVIVGGCSTAGEKYILKMEIK